MRCPTSCRQGAVTSREVGCSPEYYEHRPCGLIGLPAATSTLRFPARPGGTTSCVVPHLLAKTGSSSRELGLLFRVRTASNLRRARMRGAPSLGSRSQSRYQPRRSTCEQRSQPRPTFRPRRFARPRRLTLSTTSWACFIPQPRPGFTSQGFVPATWPGRLVVGPCPPVVDRRLLPPRCRAGSRSGNLAFRALIRVAIRSDHRSVYPPRRSIPSQASLLRVHLWISWRSLHSPSAHDLRCQLLRVTPATGLQRLDRYPA